MYKKIATTSLEDIGSGGGTVSIAKFTKQEAGMTSAYIDKVRVSFILEDIAGSATNTIPFGWLWTVITSGTSSDSHNGEYIVGASASGHSGGGVVTIPVNRRIVDNDFDSNSGQNALLLVLEATDATVTADVDVRLVIETWGRWHEVALI